MESLEPEKLNTEYSPRIHPYLAVIILSIATFMEFLDTTVANVAISRIAGDLSATAEETGWVLSSYLIANAVALPVSGWLAMRFGRKRFYLTCLVIFIISSLFCGLSQNLETLIFFRDIQGFSGSGLPTSEQSLIADITPPDKLGRAFSMFGSIITLAAIIGPTFGGFITDTLSWHWIFLINVPIGIMCFFLVSNFIHETPKAIELHKKFVEARKSVDWMGIILFGIGIGAVEVIFEQGQKENWFESDFILVLSMVAFFSLLIGVTWELYHEQPAVDIEMFTNRNFTLACILIFTVRFVTFGTTFLIPFMAQNLLDYTAMNSGLILLPGSITLFLMIQVVGYLIDKFDPRIVLSFGMIVIFFALWNLASFSLQVGFNDLVLGRVFQMFGLAFLSTTMMAVAFYYVKPEKSDRASSLISIAGNTGASFGIAFTTTYIAKRAQIHINNSGYHTTLHNPNFTDAISNISNRLQHAGQTAIQATNNAYQIMWDTVIRQSTMNAVLDTFYIYMVFILLLIPIVLLLKPKKSGSNSSNH